MHLGCEAIAQPARRLRLRIAAHGRLLIAAFLLTDLTVVGTYVLFLPGLSKGLGQPRKQISESTEEHSARVSGPYRRTLLFPLGHAASRSWFCMQLLSL